MITFLPRWAIDHTFVPSLDIGKIIELGFVRGANGVVDVFVPRHPSHVGIRHLIPYKPILVLESSVQDTDYSLDLFCISIDGRENLLRV